MGALSNRYPAKTLLIAGIALFATLSLAGTGSSASRQHRQWDRLSAVACEYADEARALALHAAEVLVSIDTLAGEASRSVPAEIMAREIGNPLAQVRRDARDFRSAVRSFEIGMRRLCEGRADGASLRNATEWFNNLVQEINAAQDEFSRTQRRLGELQTIYLLRSESPDPIRRIGKEPGFDQ